MRPPVESRDHNLSFLSLIPDPVKTMIDIGCGTGNITDRFREFVEHEKAIGIDVSKEMIAYARNNHAVGPISYFTADISSPDAFHHILGTEIAEIAVSIHCLHWIPESDQGKAMANIRSLLKPGGTCYLLIFSWCDMLPLQEQMVYHPRWRKYFTAVIQDQNSSTSHLQVGKAGERRRRRSSAPFPTFDPPPADERIRLWKQRCSELFFTDVDVTLHQVSFDFGDWKSFQGKKMINLFVFSLTQSFPPEELKSICHFLPYIPEEEQTLFLQDYYEHVKNTYAARQKSSDRDPVVLSYEYLLIRANKPSS